MNLLGLDYGKVKIGLAFADGELAEPLKVIYRPDLLEQIAEVCRELKIEKLIMGISEGQSAVKTKEFAITLIDAVGLPIEYHDETLTSQEAVAKMKEVGKRVKDEDAISAALILQGYLDGQSNNITI